MGFAQVRGKLSFADATVTGYQIHMGINTGEALSKPALIINACQKALFQPATESQTLTCMAI